MKNLHDLITMNPFLFNIFFWNIFIILLNAFLYKIKNLYLNNYYYCGN